MTRTTQQDAATKAATIAALTEALAADNLAAGHGDDPESVYTDTGDAIAGVRDYLDSTQPLDRIALAEVACAYLSGIEHATGDTDATRPAYRALRKGGLSL